VELDTLVTERVTTGRQRGHEAKTVRQVSRIQSNDRQIVQCNFPRNINYLCTPHCFTSKNSVIL